MDATNYFNFNEVLIGVNLPVRLVPKPLPRDDGEPDTFEKETIASQFIHWRDTDGKLSTRSASACGARERELYRAGRMLKTENGALERFHLSCNMQGDLLCFVSISFELTIELF